MPAKINKNGSVCGCAVEGYDKVSIMKNDIVIAPNMLNDTDFGGVPKKFTLTSGTEGGFTFTPNEQIQTGVTYTVSCMLRGNANMTLYRLNTGGNAPTSWVDRDQLSPTEYRFFEVSFSTPSGKTTNQIYICTRYGTASSQVGDWFEIKPDTLKLERGSNATAYIPANAESHSCIKPIRMNEIIEK